VLRNLPPRVWDLRASALAVFFLQNVVTSLMCTQRYIHLPSQKGDRSGAVGSSPLVHLLRYTASLEARAWFHTNNRSSS
jgi:hypothetical protein